MRILYTAPLFDASGYSNFARNFVLSLHKIGANIKTKPMKLGDVFPTLDKNDALLLSQLKAKGGHRFDINIINTLPPHFEEHRRKGCLNVGFTMFETSGITKEWVQACNAMDAILVPSQWNVETFKKSGVTVPVYSVPPGIKQGGQSGRINLPMLDHPESVYKFYSVFEWTERKNPVGLIKSYLAAFTGVENVALFLKTYAGEDTPAKKEWLAKQIKDVMENMRLPHKPRIILLPEILSSEHMGFLHQTCDCFVLPTRGEGIGLPTMEAMSYGNPVITTNFGGSLEFCRPNNSMLIGCNQTYVCNMPWIDCYEGTMTWAEPDLIHLGTLMRACYNHRGYAKLVGEAGRATMQGEFTPEKRAEHLLKVLHNIHENKIHSDKAVSER